MFERLEARRLLAAVFYDPDSESIKVHGTEGDDTVVIVRRDSRVIVWLNDDIKRTFDRAAVKWAEVLVGGGNDRVNAEYTHFAVHAWGGAGSDTLVGGWGRDHLYGGDNTDRLIGNQGDDNLDGGGGRDLIRGGNGNDTLDGQGGDDVLWGEDGQDYLSYRIGHDVLDGGAGGDWAVRFSGAGELAGIEGESVLNTPAHDDPMTHLNVFRRKDGKIVVVVTASHLMGGYERVFGDLTRNHRTFHAFVEGIDHAGPGGARTAAVETEAQSYILGQLADGAYTFNAGNPDRLLATLTFQISGGQVVTPNVSGPYAPPTFVSATRP